MPPTRARSPSGWNLVKRWSRSATGAIIAITGPRRERQRGLWVAAPGSLQVQRQQPPQHILIAQVRRPAVGGGDRFIQDFYARTRDTSPQGPWAIKTYGCPLLYFPRPNYCLDNVG